MGYPCSRIWRPTGFARALTVPGARCPIRICPSPGPRQREAFRIHYKDRGMPYPEAIPLKIVELACGFSAEDWVNGCARRPLLLIHGRDDTMCVMWRPRRCLAPPGEPKSLHTIPASTCGSSTNRKSGGYCRVNRKLLGILQCRAGTDSLSLRARGCKGRVSNPPVAVSRRMLAIRIAAVLRRFETRPCSLLTLSRWRLPLPRKTPAMSSFVLAV